MKKKNRKSRFNLKPTVFTKKQGLPILKIFEPYSVNPPVFNATHLNHGHDNAIPSWQEDSIVDKVSKRLIKATKPTDQAIRIVLEDTGALYAEDQKKHVYQIGSRRRIALLKSLNNQYKINQEVCSDIGCRSSGAFYKLVTSFNKKIRNDCKLPDNLLEIRRAVGIRINPRYKVLLPDS